MIRTLLVSGLMTTTFAVLAAPVVSAQDGTPARVAWAPSYGGSCADCALDGRNMRGWDISEAHFPGANLTGTSLQGVTANNAIFDRVSAVRSDFRDSNLMGASFIGADLSQARFYRADVLNANLTNVTLVAARLNRAKFVGCTLQDATLDAAIAQGTDFSGSNLAGSSFVGATLTDSLFDNAVLTGAVFDQTDISGASFRDAQLEGSNFETSIGFETTNFDGACGSADTRLPLGLILPPCNAELDLDTSDFAAP